MILRSFLELQGKSFTGVILTNPINLQCVCVDADEIEKINILNASLKATKLSVKMLSREAGLTDFITFVDGNKSIKNYTYPQKIL